MIEETQFTVTVLPGIEVTIRLARTPDRDTSQLVTYVMHPFIPTEQIDALKQYVRREISLGKLAEVLGLDYETTRDAYGDWQIQPWLCPHGISSGAVSVVHASSPLPPP